MNFTHIVLFQTCKDTKFVSNSQQVAHLCNRSAYCFRYAKIQNLSAIHNLENKVVGHISIVSDMQRYKICQQFTTGTDSDEYSSTLFQTYKDTKFVSNSQHDIKSAVTDRIVSDMQRYKICQQFTTTMHHRNRLVNCFRYAKIQNLSAIHNSLHSHLFPCCIVSDMQRYKICQQFTTI